MNFQNIIENIPEIRLSGREYNLDNHLQLRTEFVGIGCYTSSTKPIATWGILPCLGIGISGGGVNYLEHATPHDFQRGGSSILRMEKVIEKFRKYGQFPSVYLFRQNLNSEIEWVIQKLYQMELHRNVIFCNTQDHFYPENYVGIYNNKPFWFIKKIINPSYNRSKNYLNFNFINTNIQKAKQFSIGEYVMIRNLPYTYVILDIKSNGSRVHLYNLSEPDSYRSFAFVSVDEIIKKKSYSNAVRGRTAYSIPDNIKR
jgi:hypothetical protein